MNVTNLKDYGNYKSLDVTADYWRMRVFFIKTDEEHYAALGVQSTDTPEAFADCFNAETDALIVSATALDASDLIQRILTPDVSDDSEFSSVPLALRIRRLLLEDTLFENMKLAAIDQGKSRLVIVVPGEFPSTRLRQVAENLGFEEHSAEGKSASAVWTLDI